MDDAIRKHDGKLLLYRRNATTTARATVLGGRSGSYQRSRDDLQMLLLTTEQLCSAAYALAGHEKWLKKKHGRELKPAARRKAIKQLLTSAKFKFKNADLTAVAEQAAQIDSGSAEAAFQRDLSNLSNLAPTGFSTRPGCGLRVRHR